MVTHLKQRLIATVTVVASLLATPQVATAQFSVEVLHAFSGGTDDGANPYALLQIDRALLEHSAFDGHPVERPVGRLG